MKCTAEIFIDRLKANQSDKEFEKIRRYFKADDSDNHVIGVRMKIVFDLAKEFKEMPVDELDKLLSSPYYEARMGAVSMMDFQVRGKSVPEDHRKKLFDLYLKRHERLNSWDFMDRAAPRVVGGYLYECGQPRDILYKLAHSDNPWERRTAIVSTAYFIRKGECADTFKIAEILITDSHEFVQKAVGTWIRHAGQTDRSALLRFLGEFASQIPRPTLTTAVEKLNPDQKSRFRSL